MQNQDKKDKQGYLRTEILEQNFDPEQFIMFLNEQLHINSNLDKCSFQQLKEIVQQFKTSKQKESKIIQSIGQIRQSQSQLNESTKPKPKPKNILMKKYNPPLVEQEFTEVHKCVKTYLKYNQSQIDKIHCEVGKPERKYIGGLMGIGATSFLEFPIRTPLMGWEVGRRYSDFQWLRAMLRKFYPTEVIPPIPNKKASKRTTLHIQKRIRILTYFLNDLVKIPELFNNKYVEFFLSMKDTDQFNNIKKEAESKVAYESISSTETETGNIHIWLDGQNLTFAEQLNNFTTKSQSLFKEITRNSKSLQQTQITQVNLLYEMGNQFASLQEQSSKLAQNLKAKLSLSDTFIKLNNMMIQWGNILRGDIELVRNNISTFLKYVREACQGVKEVMDRKEVVEAAYVQKKVELDRKREKIFLLHDAKKWEVSSAELSYIPKSSIHNRSEAFKIMLPKESTDLQTHKHNYSFHLSRIYQNGLKYLNKTSKLFSQNFGEFSIKYKVSNQQMGVMWNEMCHSFSRMDRDKYQSVKIGSKIEEKDLLGEEYELENSVRY